MKKRLALLLTGLLILSVAGCAGNGNHAAGTETDSSSEVLQSEPENGSDDGTGSGNDVWTEELYLQKVFAEHDMKVGTCLSTQMIHNEQTKQIILDQFNSVTMENSMKPDYLFNKEESIAAGELVVEFDKDALEMMEFAKENNLAMRGHTLIWYSQTPDWIFYEDFDTGKNLVGRDVMLSRMESYIKQVFEQLTELGYADLFYAYDVVNEAWMDDGSMRENNWSATIGDDYLWQAFYYADQYAPEHIDLYYNDYNEQYKTGALLEFVDTLKDENGNYLIDGVGFQAHLYTGDNLNKYFRTIDSISATGLKIQITELDVSLGTWQNTLEPTDVNLKVQGKFYYDLVNGLFERKDAGTLSMDSLTFWGFADELSWRKEASPLLFDQNYQPKYSFFGAMQMKERAGLGQ